jgi:cytochrome b involved in lipid metabolism
MEETKAYTLEELKQHTTETDCWLAINGKVYNVTDFLDEHPGEK